MAKTVVLERKPLSFSERTYLPQIATGLKTTFSNMFKPKVTLQYPEEKPHIPNNYRGVPTLVKDPNGREKCVSCQLCEFVCPPKAIRITPPGQSGEVDREGAEKMPKEFEINMLRCIYCGFCQEVCPEEAIFLLKDYAITGESREELIYDKEKLLSLGGADERAYDHHVQDGVDEGIKKWEKKTEDAKNQPAFH